MILPEWIDISEEEPKDRQVVIGYHEDTGIDIMMCRVLNDELRGHIMFTSCRGFLTDDVTHWIPLVSGIQEALIKCGYV